MIKVQRTKYLMSFALYTLHPALQMIILLHFAGPGIGSSDQIFFEPMEGP